MNELERLIRRWKREIANWLAQNQAQQQAKQKTPNLKMCPICGKFVGAKDRVCEYCDAVLEAKPQPQATSKAQNDPLNPTIIIFGICALMHLVAILLSANIPDYELAKHLWAPESSVLERLGANQHYRTLINGEFWRTATYIYLHGDLMHIFFNLMALAQLGPLTYQSYGPRRFWMITLLTGIGGGLLSALSLFFGLGSASVGLSGVLFGYAGASYIFLKNNGLKDMADRLLRGMILLNILFIVLTALNIMRIDNLAHIGGMLAGMGLGLFFQSPSAARLPSALERIVLGASFALLAYGIVRCVLDVMRAFG